MQDIDLADEMEASYIDYAMSTIVSRAIPEVRDGLKPVQRRLLFAMDDLGANPTARFRKSALVVGETMGKYQGPRVQDTWKSLSELVADQPGIEVVATAVTEDLPRSLRRPTWSWSWEATGRSCVPAVSWASDRCPSWVSISDDSVSWPISLPRNSKRACL